MNLGAGTAVGEQQNHKSSGAERSAEPTGEGPGGSGSAAMAEGDHDRLMRTIGYRFGDRALLSEALTHRSRVNESASDEAHNERLEFLGDAVVDLSIGHYLMDRLPDAREGQLSKLRAMVVSEASLASAARDLSLGDYLRLGRGEAHTGGADKASILSDAFEALIGAIYLDGGFAKADSVVRVCLSGLASAAVQGQLDRDHKTRLQELAQRHFHVVPTYEVVDERGPDHEKEFEVAVSLESEEIARAPGTSKKEAEQAAARMALEQLEEST